MVLRGYGLEALGKHPQRRIFPVDRPPADQEHQGNQQENMMAKKSGGGLFHAAPKGVQAPKQTSMTQNTSVGSGSRPTRSKIAIETSAPADPQGLGRKTPGALK